MATKRSPIEILLSLIDKVSGPGGHIRATLGAIGRTADLVREKLDKVGDAGKKMMAAGAVLGGLVLAPTVAFSHVEEASAPLKVALGTMDKLRTSAYAWSNAHRESTETYLQGAYKMVSANLDEQTAIIGTNKAMALARVTMGEAVGTSETLAVIYNNFADKVRPATDEFNRIGDAIANTQVRFQYGSLDQITMGLSYATGASKSLGISLEQTLVAMGEMKSAGLTAEMVGSGYAMVVNKLEGAAKTLGIVVERPRKGVVDLLGTVGNLVKKYGDLSQATPQVRESFRKAFGDENFKAIMALMSASKDFVPALDAIGNSAGTVDKNLHLFEDFPTAKIEIMKNKVMNLADTIGERLAPMVIRATDKVSGLLDRMDAFAKAHPALTTFLGKLAGGAAVTLGFAGATLFALATVGKFVTYIFSGIGALGQLGFAFQAVYNWGQLAAYVLGGISLPIIVIAAAVVLLIAQIYYLATHFEKVKAWAGHLTFLGQTLLGVFLPGHAMIMGFLRAWDLLAGIGAKLKVYIQPAIDWMSEAGSRLMDALAAGIRSGWETLKSALSWILEKIKPLFWQSDPREGPMRHTTAMGRMLPATLAKGVLSGWPALQSATEALTGRMADYISAPPAPSRRSEGGAVRGGNRIGSIHVTVNGSSGSSERAVEDAVLRVLNRFSYEVGR